MLKTSKQGPCLLWPPAKILKEAGNLREALVVSGVPSQCGSLISGGPPMATVQPCQPPCWSFIFSFKDYPLCAHHGGDAEITYTLSGGDRCYLMNHTTTNENCSGRAKRGSD